VVEIFWDLRGEASLLQDSQNFTAGDTLDLRNTIAISKYNTDLGGRMHSKGKGIARRCLPYRKAPPSWVQISTGDLVEQIVKLAKKGSSPSQIGVVLRDSYGVPQVKGVTGSKILRILKKAGLAPQIPEDLYHMIKKAVNVRKHLEKFRKDRDAKFRLILIESRIYRLARYYRKTKQLPATWRYNSKKADTLI